MERLRPFSLENILVKNAGELKIQRVDSELGVFGFVLGSSQGIREQAQYGHIMRTKPSSSCEGGISTGVAAHDAPFLI